MSTPSFSVVIPLYNKAPHIRRTLESVLCQTMQPIEIIVVNDGSTDGSGEIVAAINHPLIKLIGQNNAGVSAARNTGLRVAIADYVAFLDADDSWFEWHMEELARLAAKFPRVGLYSTMHEIHYGNRVFTPYSAYPIGHLGPVDNFYLRFAKGLSLVSSSTVAVHRTILLDMGGFPEGIRRGEDVITWVELARRYGAAHSARVTAIINRAAVNRSAQICEKDPPGSLLYLATLLQDKMINTKEKCDIRRLFSSISFFTAAGMREAGNMKGIISILSLVHRIGMRLLSVKITLLFLTPPGFLTYARHWRHRRLMVKHPVHEI